MGNPILKLSLFLSFFTSYPPLNFQCIFYLKPKSMLFSQITSKKLQCLVLAIITMVHILFIFKYSKLGDYLLPILVRFAHALLSQCFLFHDFPHCLTTYLLNRFFTYSLARLCKEEVLKSLEIVPSLTLEQNSKLTIFSHNLENVI